MQYRTVRFILPAQQIDMGGFPVKQAIPTNRVPHLDPFLLLHHARVKPIRHKPAKSQGVGPHPHRGFSPVTFVIEGEIHHRDSRGNSQIAKQGEVQWMHAGRGIIHSERPTEALVERMGAQEIVQLWINSPAIAKMRQPHYQHLTRNQMPILPSLDPRVKINLVAGEFSGLRTDTQTQSPLLLMWGHAETQGQYTFSISAKDQCLIYLIRGKIKVAGYGSVEKEHLIVFEQIEAPIEISFLAESQFIVMSGPPLREEIAQQGPFVMNNQTELLEAMRDYSIGKMGILIEE